MKKGFFTIILIVLTVGTFYGQQSVRGPFRTNGFFDNWFISAGVGGNVYFGESDADLSLGDRIAPALDLSLGKWMTPTTGFRFQYAGITAKGKGIANYHFANSSGDEKFNVMNLHADFLFNLSNIISGYRTDRFWDLVPYIGVGWAKSWKDDVDPEYNEAAPSFGLINKFRLSDALDLNLEVRGMYVNERFDGVKGGRSGEGMGSATIGFSYKFNKRTFDSPEKPIIPDYTPYTTKISDLEQKIANSDAKAKQLADEISAEKNKAPKVVTNTEYLAGKMAIWFEINGTKLTDKDLINLGDYADIIKKSGLKYKITGSADKQTGNKKINQKLSEKRANTVYDALVNKFGVDPSKLEVVANGDKDQRYKKAPLNRVVVIE
jgi:outer membrane protein OmpA-like peptidoglycan-associated protein